MGTILSSDTPLGADSRVNPLDMELDANGDLILLLSPGGAPISKDLVSPDALHPNPPDFTKGSPSLRENDAFFINKFDASGNVVYGSYILPHTGDGIDVEQLANSSLSNQYLEVGTDGTIYIHTTIRKSPGQTGVLPTTAGAF